jgi:copper(I)-binding protein
MRLPWTAVAGGAAVAALGATGLIRGAMPQSAATSGNAPSAPIVVTGAFVRPPVPPTTNAAAYFTIYNTTSKPDELLSVESGAGADTVLHTAGMQLNSNRVIVPAHGKLALSVGHGHVMIEKVTGTLRAGQQVNLELDFANAGPINVSAPVVPFTKTPPTPSGAPS